MGHKRRKKNKHPPCFVFTQETLTLTQRALKCFEGPLNRADHQNTRVMFAEETMQQIKKKLETMKLSVGALCLITFDYNETLILAQAIRMYTLDLLSAPRTPKSVRELHSCKKLTAHFNVSRAKTP